MSHDNSIGAPSQGQLLMAALNYARLGWPVLPLHDVSIGTCSCRDGKECSAPGKHPRASGWRETASVIEGVIRSWWDTWPLANVGIMTGVAARLWVLDVDPVHDGDVRLAELMAENGALGTTKCVVTGSGGTHWYWTLPEEFTPTNAKGRLPAGIDVRGEGGLVVAPPSVSGLGAYIEMYAAGQGEIARAPFWLEELIRPIPPGDSQKILMSDSPPVSLVHHDLSHHPYAAAVVEKELTRLRDAVPGTRGRTAFEVACNLIEMCNSPWTGVNAANVQPAFEDAALTAMALGGQFNLVEAGKAWASARHRVGGNGRPKPEMAGGVLIDWGQLGGVPPFSSPAAISQPVDKPVGFFIPSSDLDGVMPPQWLVDGWLPTDSVTWLVGPPSSGKSFVAVSLALSVASGVAWHDVPVRQGKAIYVAAEGVGGMWSRVRAWEKTHHDAKPVNDCLFLPTDVQVADELAWWDFIEKCMTVMPGLIVLDTQARISVGMEENSSKEMGLFVHRIEALRRATGACVLVVHHSGKNGASARGSSALFGAASAEITVTRVDDAVEIKNTKQKDAEITQSLNLRKVPVNVGVHPQARRRALENPYGFSDPLIAQVGAVLTQVSTSSMRLGKTASNKDRLMNCVREVFALRGGTKAEIRAISCTEYGASRAGFYRAWDELVALGTLARVTIDDRPTSNYIFKPFDDRENSHPETT